MNALEIQLLTLAEPLLKNLVGAALAALAAMLIAKLQKNARTANLAAVAQAAEDALHAALTTAAAEGAKPDLATIAASAKAAVLADLPTIEKSLEAELDVLIHGQIVSAVAANGNTTVNMPSIVPAPKNAGVVPLLIIAIIAVASVIVGGGIALVATGNASQELSCIEQDINGNPAALGTVISGLSTQNGQIVTGGLEALGPALAQCTLVELYDDVKATLARNAVLKANTAPVVAPLPQIKTAAMIECAKRGWLQPKAQMIHSTATGTSSSSSATSSTSGALTK